MTILFVVSRDWNFLVCSCLLQPKHDGIESTSLVSVTQETNEQTNKQTNKQVRDTVFAWFCYNAALWPREHKMMRPREGTRELFHVAL